MGLSLREASARIGSDDVPNRIDGLPILGPRGYDPLPVHGLSAPHRERALKVWLDFVLFGGLALQTSVPDETTPCRFRNALVKGGVSGARSEAEGDRSGGAAGAMGEEGVDLHAGVQGLVDKVHTRPADRPAFGPLIECRAQPIPATLREALRQTDRETRVPGRAMLRHDQASLRAGQDTCPTGHRAEPARGRQQDHPHPPNTGPRINRNRQNPGPAQGAADQTEGPSPAQSCPSGRGL